VARTKSKSLKQGAGAGETELAGSSASVSQKISQEEMAELVRLKEERIKLAEGLPFLYGWKWYPWAREFFESTNKINLLCAANQISKSSTQIRKAIDWATNKEKWPRLWRKTPNQFWYLYPTANQATIEFRTKWKEFLPSGEFKEHPTYGWKEEIKNKEIFAIHFKSGVSLYFKTYSQDVESLQTGSVDAIFCDEELPEDLYSELIFRISATNGFFHMVFTATLGQEFWRKALEPGPDEEPNLPEASKWQVSMYDCMFYEDKTPSHWTSEKIAIIKQRCKSHTEVLRRVYGKFVLDTGRKFQSFNVQTHVKSAHPIPASWYVYSGVDIGSGGEKNHPAAICFVAVRPDYQQGRVFLGWRGDGIETTVSDIVEKYIEIKTENKVITTQEFYDWGSKDFRSIATRMGETAFQPADKARDKGEEIINVLFRNNMLYIYDQPELQKLAGELLSVRHGPAKNKLKDDFVDALRYAVSQIPWDWSCITAGDAPEEIEKPKTDLERQIDERRKAFFDNQMAEEQRIEEEFNEWNDLYG
jgi:phage terminase large subunit-like protein